MENHKNPKNNVLPPPCSIQRSFFCRLTEDKKSEKFFRVFYDRMKLAQLEIKATVTVNTSDLGNRKRDDDSQDKDGPVRKKGQMSPVMIQSTAGCIRSDFFFHVFTNSGEADRLFRSETYVFSVRSFLRSARESSVVMTEDVREQLLEASSATKKAFNSYRREADPEDHFNVADGQSNAGDKNQDDGEMSFVIVIMQPILRFLQLLCENHNRDLQVGEVSGFGLHILFFILDFIG